MLCGNEARAEDEVEGRKRLLRPRQAQPRMRTKRNIDLTGREYCYDLRRTTFATTATAFHCTRWVVVVVLPPRSAGTPGLSPPPRMLFSRPPHIFTFPRLSPPPPSRSPAMQHQPNPTATVYSLRYLRLLDLLRDERATEPRLRTEDPVEWLAWAHAVRWLIVSPLRLLVMFVLKLGIGSVSCSTRGRERLPMGTLASPPSIRSRKYSP